MKKWLLAACCLYAGTAFAQYAYPATKKADSVNTYFGVAYKDPYQWLENLKDMSVLSWFKQQANFTDSILQKIDGRDQLLAEWKRLDSLQPAHISDRVFANGRIFYKKRMSGEKLAKLYVREGDNGAERLLFDPLSFISGKTLSIQQYVPSFDGKYSQCSLLHRCELQKVCNVSSKDRICTRRRATTRPKKSAPRTPQCRP